MKKLFTLICSLGAYCASAQTTIYSQNFNASSSTPAEWTLMSADLGGVTSTAGNQWIINNAYAAGPLGTATANQPAGITGGPTSNYMHINCGPGLSSFYGNNANFNSGATGDTYFAVMNTPVVTTGYTGVSFKFWWLCNGSSAADGKVYYRTSSAGAWTLLTAPISSYFGNSSWSAQTITLAAFDNQAFLEFGFQFRDELGSDPAFAVDEIAVTGFGGSTTIAASMTASNTVACQDSCLTFTNTSTGTVDSFKWSSSNATIAGGGTTSPANICFPQSGTNTVKLYLYVGGVKVDSASQIVNITPSPSPVITLTGSTLSVPALYTAYQWYSGLTPIAGATSATYTYTITGVYGVVVDSAGCRGVGIYSTLGIENTNAIGNTFRVVQQEANSLSLYASYTLSESIEVSVFDATGRVVLRENWLKGTSSLQLNNVSFPSGLYIVKLSNNNTSVRLKWLKQ